MSRFPRAPALPAAAGPVRADRAAGRPTSSEPAGRWPSSEFLTLTSTTSLVVVVDGVLVHEWYAEAVSAEDRLLGNSATKSALALLTGIAVGRGSLPDLDAGVCDYVPELLGSGYDRVTVRQVLTMTSGLDWAEDYHDPDSRASRLIGRWREGTGGMRDLLRTHSRRRPRPGTRYAYCSPDSMVLDWVRERATGQTFAEALADAVAADRRGATRRRRAWTHRPTDGGRRDGGSRRWP